MSDVRTERRTKNKPTTLNEGVRESSDEQTIKEMPGEGQDERLGARGYNNQNVCCMSVLREALGNPPSQRERRAKSERRDIDER
jgi:hypothetical protein